MRNIVLAAVLFVVGVGSMGALYISLGENLPLQIASLVAFMGGALLVIRELDRWSLKTQIRWLESLPFEIDQEAYFQALGIGHGSSAKVTVQVTFESALDEASRQIVADAVVGAAKNTVVSFEGSTLVACSPSLRSETRSNGQSRANNGRPHRWFRSLANGVLGTIHRSHRVAHVDVTIT